MTDRSAKQESCFIRLMVMMSKLLTGYSESFTMFCDVCRVHNPNCCENVDAEWSNCYEDIYIKKWGSNETE